MAYPAQTQMPPPVPPPVGQALEVPFQKYIVVDQFGYRPEHTKVAVLADPKSGWNAPDAYEPGSELEVRTWADGKVVFKGAPSVWNGGAVDAAAGDRGSWFDFTPLKTAGLYYVFDPKTNGRSHAFSIGVDVYRPVLKTALRMFFSPPEFKLIPIDEATWAPAQIALAWSPDRLSDRRSERALSPAEVEAIVDQLERTVAHAHRSA
jgi:hypothetical protein